MAQVLLTVSGTVDPQVKEKIASGARPRADYLEMAREFGADIVDYATARRDTGLLGWMLERVGGPNLRLAWVCFRRRNRYRAIFTDGEQVGIPLALMLKLLGRGKLSARHLMISHILSVSKKLLFFDLFGIQSHIDRFLVYSSWQRKFIVLRLGVAPEKVEFTPFMVDARFFSPNQVTSRRAMAAQAPIISSVGLEHRDYPTLLEAVRGLRAQVVIAAASLWSKQKDSTDRAHLPENVRVAQYSQYDLRQLYADSQFVVIPLFDVEFQAGVTAILEAMAMERAVICSRTPGQTDVVVDGKTGLYVPVGDAPALRAAIERLLNNPDEATSMGKAGRQLVEERMNLDLYTRRLRRSIQAVLESAQRGGSARGCTSFGKPPAGAPIE